MVPDLFHTAYRLSAAAQLARLSVPVSMAYAMYGIMVVIFALASLVNQLYN